MEKASAVNRRMVELRSLGVTELSGFHPIGSGESGENCFIDFPELAQVFDSEGPLPHRHRIRRN